MFDANVSEAVKVVVLRGLKVHRVDRHFPTPAVGPSVFYKDDTMEGFYGRLKVLSNSKPIGWLSKELDFNGRTKMIKIEGDASNALVVRMQPGKGSRILHAVVCTLNFA